MKILYLGPYRQNDDIGILSRYYLDNLSDIGSVTSRPIYLNTNTDDKNIFFKTENSCTDFDYIVQHLPIKKLCPNTLVKKNICIPILDNTGLSDQDKEKLNCFYKILADTIYSYRLFKSNKLLKPPIKAIRPNINQDLIKTKNNYNLRLYNLSKKIYCILDYKTNNNLLETLINSFAIASKFSIANTSYLLFVHNLNPNDTQNLQNYIKSRYELVGCKKKIINTILIPCAINEESLIVAHNTGDIFLNITDSYQNSIHRNYATQLGKKIIDQTEIKNSYSYIVNNIYHTNGKIHYTIDDIIKVLIANTTEKSTFSPRIIGPELLC